MRIVLRCLLGGVLFATTTWLLLALPVLLLEEHPAAPAQSLEKTR
jgi:hypothetical protein